MIYVCEREREIHLKLILIENLIINLLYINMNKFIMSTYSKFCYIHDMGEIKYFMLKFHLIMNIDRVVMNLYFKIVEQLFDL